MIRQETDMFDPSLRSQGYCIIVAVSKSRNIPVGFIRYSFLWYNLSIQTCDKEKDQSVGLNNPSSKQQQNSELIIHIKNLRDFGVCRELNLSSIMLLTLALEHARRLRVWYGTLDSANAHCASFFNKYFRMKYAHAFHKGKVTVSEHTMILNLHRLNFNYSVALWVEDRQQPWRENQSITQTERMIVCLGDVHTSDLANQRIADGLSRASYSNIQELNHRSGIYVRLSSKSISAMNDESADISIECLTNANESLEKEQIINSLITCPEVTMNGKLSLPPESYLSSWDVLNCFPYSYTATNQLMDQDESFILKELRKKQQDLSQLETSMAPKLRKLLGYVYDERIHFESRAFIQAEIDREYILAQYDSLLKRRLEVSIAKEVQLEIDMDAVCHVCNDGDVSPTNQIIFCDSCNVAVHQNCYGITNVPEGDYFCNACRYFNRTASRSSDEEKKSPPIVCELCPCREGAFYRCHQIQSRETNNSAAEAKWCHVVCAKWQGIVFVDHTDNILEDVSAFKQGFLRRGISCYLCQGVRGTYNKCHDPHCQNYMHITCARTSGLCRVNHGENHEGLLNNDQNPWTLFCPEHSSLDSDHSDTNEILQKLRDSAKSFPPEQKPFDCMSYTERERYLADAENERNLYLSLINRPILYRCEVCNSANDGDDQVKLCGICNVSFHRDCLPGWQPEPTLSGNSTVICPACIYDSETSKLDFYERPRCHMCNCSDGLLVKGCAEPVSKKKWKKGNAFTSSYKRSLFGKQIWCHAICAM